MKKQYGLLGHPLGHTLSPIIHKRIMKDCGIDGSYRAYDIDPDRFEADAENRMKELDGFNVTIPFKERILPLLNEVDETCRIFGAVNTVSGRRGYNTDSPGFRQCGVPFLKKKVLLLGAGGAARVMLHEAVRGGAEEIAIVSRRPEQAEKLRREVSINPGFEKVSVCAMQTLLPDYDIILNATPVGMWPDCDGIPVPKEILLGAEYVFDAIYNPLATKLVLAARSMGIPAQSGLDMLYYQALEAQKIWNPDADFSMLPVLFHKVRLKKALLRHFPVKYVLTGFMASGKTTVGKALAKMLGVGFVDLDVCVVEEKKKPIFEIFRTEGEEAFREAERSCLLQVLNEKRTLVIATGGGALMNPANVQMVRDHQGFIILLSADLETVLSRVGQTSDRPLLHGKKADQIRELFESRIPAYHSIADCVADTEGSVCDVARNIKTMLEG